ncbi:MAG: 2-oxoacid:ferredoxin oxidoreductase subunit beta [Candidatus Marinimicrobia bacterium]|jgi:2-oxoglutarate ferredoxin oxidoreductase subunit beta|nr:2-oxoacid:ferredoxin oxidoreductase subunit beta [Candidatus Neomarinimicrobiota bacterium]MDP6033008.1 2-oxoacid:ferredoxin oxidoreductase subunit beta [Candidatus Neomarinimicrobiota bacterium]MDP7330669.1 2-oxoacid:ferredoxin oxidoreductase subunit beta [Candidatus Neomarinimicrobiota bacterium]|tara:strand:+ start:4854 stop:5870 length:1017 start_codon:yes stop_codon:yes gene_type:complete
MADSAVQTYSRADFSSDQSVRWCPGCGDYAILAQTQKVFPELGIKKENFVFISGIGCSSRFPYYMNTYGFHTIHGRATAIASGVKLANPNLSVWVVTGDGDGLSIGGNHTIHLMRRNLDINVMLFNNRIYGLTKGQYSPTSERGKITKSSPMGSLDCPFNPLTLVLGAGATFVARTIDRETKHMQEMITRSYGHKGTSFLETYQNCNIFNNGAYTPLTDKGTKADSVLWLEDGKPMVFGSEKNKGIRLDGNKPIIVEIGDKWGLDDVLVHDESDYVIASLLSNLTYQSDFPDPIGVLYAIESVTYEDLMMAQINEAIKKSDKKSVQDILNSGDTWIVE